MAMVMPRSRSSGALSIWSKAMYLLAALALASTLVMAAVSVVLPWSMCPMVPTFTCGFVRSNFFFAISQMAPSTILCDQSAKIKLAIDMQQPSPGRLTANSRLSSRYFICIQQYTGCKLGSDDQLGRRQQIYLYVPLSA